MAWLKKIVDVIVALRGAGLLNQGQGAAPPKDGPNGPQR